MYTKPIPVTNPPRWVPAVSSPEALYIDAHRATYNPPSGDSNLDLYKTISGALIHHGREGMNAIREFLGDSLWKLPLCWAGIATSRMERLIEFAMCTAGRSVDQGDSESAAVHYAIAARLDTENPTFREDALEPNVSEVIKAICDRSDEKLATALGNLGFTMAGLYLGSRRVAAQALREGRLASVIPSIIGLYADDISAARTQSGLEVLMERARLYRELPIITEGVEEKIEGKRAVLSASKHSNLFVPIPEGLQSTFLSIQTHFPSDNPMVKDAMNKIGGGPYYWLIEFITNRKIWGWG